MKLLSNLILPKLKKNQLKLTYKNVIGWGKYTDLIV